MLKYVACVQNKDDIRQYFDEINKYPIVVKFDGLAQGKGVFVCNTREEAVNATHQMLFDENWNRT